MTAGRAGRLALCLAALPALGLFYVRYVPLVGPFQAALVPFLVAVAGLALARPAWGMMAFIFALPLVNSLPYFFGLSEPLPMAPTALVLGLAFLWADFLRRSVSPAGLPAPDRIRLPLVLLAALVAASGLITLDRYAGFFPFLADGVYEWTANAHHVSAGGAIMSVVFTSLNFLTGVGLFLAFRGTLTSRARVRRALVALGAGTGVSMAFALLQQFAAPRLGNNPISISGGLINATFKDAMSFGGFMAIVAPVFLGAFLRLPAVRSLPFLALSLSAVVMIFLSGSRSGLIALLLTIPGLGLLFLASRRARRGSAVRAEAGRPGRPRLVRAAWIAISLAVVLGIAWRTDLAKTLSRSKTVLRLNMMLSDPSLKYVLYNRGDTLWPIALAMLKDYPVTGVGAGGYIIEMSNYAVDKKIDIGTPESPENLPLLIGSELGLAGLFVAAWIFWEIGRKGARQWKALAAAPRDRFLLAGLAGGIVAFALISLVHTFIWSYEIHYTFWLMAALVFALGEGNAPAAGEPGAASRVPKSRAARILFPAALLIFSAVHLWNSTHSLSLESRAAKYGFKQDFGFYQQEKTADGRDFRWTGKRAGTELLIEKARLEVPLLASHPDISERPVRVRVFLVRRFFKDKRLLGERILKDSDWRTHEFDLAPEDVGHSAVLLFQVDRTWVPRQALGVTDPRRLGVGVGAVRFKDPRP